MIQASEIQKIADKLRIRDTQIEKDYIISWILKGISNQAILKEKLIFKGGTALRKIHFTDYRLSEDLDFTYADVKLNIDSTKKLFSEQINWIEEKSRITLSIQDETQHDTGNYNFYFAYVGPLGGKGKHKSIKVDISGDEKIINDPELKAVENEYSDLSEEYKINVYTLAEIIAEKMRSLIQRTAPRDLYDVWYLFEIEGKDIEDYISDFNQKTRFKKLDPRLFLKRVQEKQQRFKNQWENQLVNQIQDVPNFDDVWRELGKHWRKFGQRFEK